MSSKTTTKKTALSKRKPSSLTQIALQWAIWLLLGAMIVTIESKSAMGAYHVQLDHVTGIQMGVLSLICAVVAFIANGVAGAFKDDVRPHVRARAKAARFVSIAFLIVPICFLGSSLKWDSMEREWIAYTESAAYTADQATAQDPMADRYDREAARQRLTRPSDPNLSAIDGEFWIATFLQAMLIFAADALRVPVKATASETNYWRRKAANERKRQREAEKKKEEQRNMRKNNVTPLFGRRSA